MASPSPYKKAYRAGGESDLRTTAQTRKGLFETQGRFRGFDSEMRSFAKSAKKSVYSPGAFDMQTPEHG